MTYDEIIAELIGKYGVDKKIDACEDGRGADYEVLVYRSGDKYYGVIDEGDGYYDDFGYNSAVEAEEGIEESYCFHTTGCIDNKDSEDFYLNRDLK